MRYNTQIASNNACYILFTFNLLLNMQKQKFTPAVLLSLTSLATRYKNVPSILHSNIVQHVAYFNMDEFMFEDDEHVVGGGTLKVCMSERNCDYLNDVETQLFECLSLSTINSLLVEMSEGTLDCIYIDEELHRLQRIVYKEECDSVNFYKNVIEFIDEFNKQTVDN